ncbi:two-component system sensor histidine kinase NtrB [Desulfosporosinus metallidurans]|uniref:histidine kinase n=1 Tax=Desulfosporosinus metallidurans TaxID=1888891 RepID=A0A1Q8R2H8_9FIRM|nr:ATP-binding protein [Desulfosporosinus metallidurans]OLN33789.1 histidine kinase sensor protein [Desulfosporosinus metallidurans]
MIFLNLRTLHRQSVFIFLSILLIIDIAVINILTLPSFFRIILVFFPYISVILWFDLWVSTGGKVWILSTALLLSSSLAYPRFVSAPLLILHIFFLLLMFGMIFFYEKNQVQERLLHQHHLKAMRVLLRQDPPIIQTVDYTRQAIILLDNRGFIIEANHPSSLLLSLPETSLIGQPISDVLGILLDFQTADTPENGEFTLRTQESGEKHLRFVTRTLLDSHIPSGTLVMLFDISKEKQRSEAYLQTAKLSALSQVSAGLAHEIRNPLTTIKGFMQLITPEQWPESFRPYQQLMLDEIQTIVQLLNKFVLMTSPSAPQMQPINLTETIHALVHTIQPIRLMQGVTLGLELSAHEIYVMGDPEQLSQALLSLLNNAIEASPNEGKIIIRLKEDQANVRISVIDNGPGIPENLRHRVLDPFFTTQEEGTGLGLTIAQQIILAHHGKLHFSEALPPCGTEAMIDLPSLSSFTNSLSA